MLKFSYFQFLNLNILFIFFYYVTYANIRNKRIVGGYDISTVDIPYIVSLQSRLFKFHQCGGTIIASQWILSAAHCPISGNKLYHALVGANSDATEGKTFDITHFIKHPKFSTTSMDYDIALAKLEHPIGDNSGGKIISLPARNEPDHAGEVVRVSGWGWNFEGNGENLEKLRTVYMDIIDHDTCFNMYKNRKKISRHMICASRLGKDACHSDSGGPMTINNDLKVIGIVSWGGKCADKNYPGVYAKVSSFVDWIHATQKRY